MITFMAGGGLSKTKVNKLIGGKTPNTIVLLGDSVTAGCEPFYLSETSGSRDSSWWHFAQGFLDYRFKVVNYAGAGGETLSEIVARIETDVIAYAPHYCAFGGGANSINETTTADEMVVLFESALNKLSIAKIIPIVFPPFLSGNYTAAANIEKWFTVNRWLQDNAESLNFYLVDLNAAYIDYDASGPHPLSGTVETDDLVHPNGTGAMLIGRYLATELKKIVPHSFSPRIISNADTNILNTNPLMSGTAGTANTGITGDVATGYELSVISNATAVAAKVLRDDGIGYWQSINLTASADDGKVTLMQETALVAGDVGENIYGIIELLIPDDIAEADQITDLSEISLLLRFYNSTKTTTYMRAYSLFHTTGAEKGYSNGFTPGDRLILKTPSYTIPDGCELVKTFFSYAGQSGGGGTIYVGSHGIFYGDSDI